MKEYIVSARVNFITPTDVMARTDNQAERLGLADIKSKVEELCKQLNDVAELSVELDYVECQD